MIAVKFNLRNPWSDRFANVWYKNYRLTKHKTLELQIYKSNDLLEVSVEYTARRDHAGLNIELGLIGYNFIFNVHDNRHWNYGKQQWDTYE